MAKKVGSAAAVNTAAFGAAPGAVREAKFIGDTVLFNERIDTSGTGLVQVLFVDGSTFTVGPNSDLMIDEFVYNPDDGSGKLIASFGKGVARFVGGKLSKKKGGVSVRTPVGTIGIRGGIANLDLTRGAPVFSLVFGKELSFKGADGTSRRIYRPGYSLQVGGVGGGVRRTSAEDLEGVQSSLMSKSGQRGGATVPPTGTQVRNSGMTQVNSDLGRVYTAPRRKPQAVLSTSSGNAETTLVQVQKVNRKHAGISSLASGATKTGRSVDIRVLSAGATFTSLGGGMVSSPGAQGLIGGSAGLSETATFIYRDIAETGDRETTGTATGVARATIGGHTVAQFLYPGKGGGFYAQTLTNKGIAIQEFNEARVPAVPEAAVEVEGTAVGQARGAVYFNEDFHAFAHVPDVTPAGSPSFQIEDMIFGISGTETDFSTFGNAADPLRVRSYSLHADPTTLFSLGTDETGGGFTPMETGALFVNPLVAGTLGADFLSETKNTGFLIKETDPETLDGAHYLASSFHLKGAGTSQKSLISLAVGAVDLGAVEEGGLATARRGSHRIDALQSAGLYSGGLQGVKGSDGSAFFGANAQSFVFGSSLTGGASGVPYTDDYVERPDAFASEETVSATLHVALLDEDAGQDVSALARSDRTLTGYASGVLESTVNYHDPGVLDSLAAGGATVLETSVLPVAAAPAASVGPVHFTSDTPDDVSVTFNSAEETLGGALTVRDLAEDDPEVYSYTVGFGATGSGSSPDRATFIDDDIYAAWDSADAAQTYLTSTVNEKLDLLPGTSPNTYFVPGTLVPGADDVILAPVATQCVCAFLEWGYWGTSMRYEDTGGVLGGAAERTDTFHLGTWVAGAISGSGDLPASGSASYAGQAVGNVVSNGAQYLAAGGFSMTVDFASRTGTAAISDFDNRSFSATLSERAIAGGNHFTGALSGDAVGTLNTSIVGGPLTGHDGVIGNFNAADPAAHWSASGIVAGGIQ
ncbi:FecR domain-containing protein [Roseibium aggregatum]|uniref:FecR domain-containing protein n=1 Tax=Roseibium aggregatum TaxID=187304 RepID=A0A939E9T9_9HYPH|nr:FecR domain-containing protein [Roseibium aggregatum]MBN9669496.1 FecR domain-containing protein [Roseibium aggregatum]